MIRKTKYFLAFAFYFVCSSAVIAQPVGWMSLQQAQAKALKNKKKVMLFAEASWCQYCKRMHKEVFPKQSVQDSLQKYYYPVRIDVESSKKVTFNGEILTQQALSRRFRVSGTPTTIFLDSKGKILGTQPGYLRSQIFDKLLAYVGTERYKKESFKKYLHDLGIQVQ